MKICFCARPCYDRFSVDLFKSIRSNYDNQIKGIFITNDRLETEYIKSKIENADVSEVSAFFEINWNKFTIDKLGYYERKYNCAPIWKIIYTDRFLINCDYEYCVRTTVGLFMFFEEVFLKGDVDYYYDETISTLQSYVAYIVGKEHGVQYISQMTARGKDSTHHYFLKDPYQYNSKFNYDYQKCSYDDSIVKLATDYLIEFETKNFKPDNMAFVMSKPRFKLKYLLLPGLWLKNRIAPKYKNKYSYMYYKQYKNSFKSILFYLRYQMSKKYYKKTDYSKKFIYYPLHLQPEASTIVCAQKYEKQLFFIDSWAKSIPADTLLYVKEHYAELGTRELDFYKQLKKFPNVVLIDPWEDTFKLIKNSVAVTTLTGTAGWEAMLLRKPVFLGGNILYDNAPGIIKIDDIYDNYLEKMYKWVQPTRKEIIHYLCEYFTTIYEGNVYAAYSDCYNEENIEKVAKSLTNYIMEMESDRSK